MPDTSALSDFFRSLLGLNAHARWGCGQTVLAVHGEEFTSSFFSLSFASASSAASTSSLLGTAGAMGSSPCS